jgi:glycosyltransferase involved in cell wall biosynthesis
MTDVTVSVIIPTYNRAHLVDRAIRSVLDQTYQDFEIIVVDDSSTDNTKEVVNSFKNEQVTYIRHQVNKRVAAARNTGIRAAKGEYIAFVDSDDECLPQRLEKQVEVFQRGSSEVGVVYTDHYRIDKEGGKHHFSAPTIMPEDGLAWRKALDYPSIGVGTAMVRRTCFNTVGLFDERIPYFEEIEFYVRAGKHFYFYHINEPLMNCYEGEESLRSHLGALIESRKIILQNCFDDVKGDRKLLASHYFGIGNLLYQDEQVSEGRYYIRKAALTYPLSIKFSLVALVSLFGQDSYIRMVRSYRKIRAWLSRISYKRLRSHRR